MDRVRYRRSFWRGRWPWKRWFPPRIDPRCCRACGLPYQNNPQPREVASFLSGNVGAVVYPAGRWTRGEFAIRFGRWKALGRHFHLSEYLAVEDLEDLVEVAGQAHEFAGQGKKSSRRR